MAHRKSGNGNAVPKQKSDGGHAPSPGWFTWFASEIAHWAGKPLAFMIALAVVIVWAASGPIFGYSDTWQLVINTSTTIVTFLMVFLIQNTQNRDTMALQVKLAELIFVMHGAKTTLATAEDLSDEALEALHQQYRRRADEALASLTRRRSAKGHTRSKAVDARYFWQTGQKKVDRPVCTMRRIVPGQPRVGQAFPSRS